MSELKPIQIRLNPAIYGAFKRIAQVRGRKIQDCTREAFLGWIENNKLSKKEMDKITETFEKTFMEVEK